MKAYDLIVAALRARGEKEMPTRATRYTAFTRTVHRDLSGELRPVRAPGLKWYVHTSGRTLRVGTDYVTSIPARTTYATLIEEGKKCSAQ